MIYVSLEKAVKQSLEDFMYEGICRTIRFLDYKYWTSSLLYAIDHIDKFRKEDGLSKGEDLSFMKDYWATYNRLPKYYAIHDVQELELFENMLKDAMYVKYKVEHEDHPDIGLLTDYEIL